MIDSHPAPARHPIARPELQVMHRLTPSPAERRQMGRPLVRVPAVSHRFHARQARPGCPGPDSLDVRSWGAMTRSIVSFAPVSTRGAIRLGITTTISSQATSHGWTPLEGPFANIPPTHTHSSRPNPNRSSSHTLLFTSPAPQGKSESETRRPLVVIGGQLQASILRKPSSSQARRPESKLWVCHTSFC